MEFFMEHPQITSTDMCHGKNNTGGEGTSKEREDPQAAQGMHMQFALVRITLCMPMQLAWLLVHPHKLKIRTTLTKTLISFPFMQSNRKWQYSIVNARAWEKADCRSKRLQYQHASLICFFKWCMANYRAQLRHISDCHAPQITISKDLFSDIWDLSAVECLNVGPLSS